MLRLVQEREVTPEAGRAAVAALVGLARELRLPVAAVVTDADVLALEARMRAAVTGKVGAYTEPGILIGKLTAQLRRAVEAHEADCARIRAELEKVGGDVFSTPLTGP